MNEQEWEDRIFDAVTDAIRGVRDAYPRKADDADSGAVADAVMLELTRLALDEQAESVLRWLDQDGTYQKRIEAQA